jgi:excisionase family DNA binding protein
MTCETMTLAEASRMLGLNRKTVLRLVDVGDLPAPLSLSTRKILWSRRILTDFLSRAGRGRRFIA